MVNPIEVVLKFEQAINSGNPEAICSLMTADGEFIDSLGNGLRGTEKLRSAWTGYFKMIPDYSISHSEILVNGNTVAIFGSAQGTFSKNGSLKKENFWKTPAVAGHNQGRQGWALASTPTMSRSGPLCGSLPRSSSLG